MKKSFLLATVLVSNVVFASIIPSQNILVEVNKLQQNSLSNMAVVSLLNKGLEKDIAQSKVSNTLVNKTLSADLMTHNLVSVIDELSLEDVVTFISEAALFDKNVDLSSYSTLVSIVQKKVGLVLSSENLNALENVSSLNEKISKLV